jgi:hypothetical protein
MRLRSILAAAGPAATVVVGGAGAASAEDHRGCGIEAGDSERRARRPWSAAASSSPQRLRSWPWMS